MDFRISPRLPCFRFIRYHVPTGSKLGIVTFSNSSATSLPLVLVTDENRELIIKRLPRRAHTFGRTAIGQGLKKALEVNT